jgi:Protein of unknown function (DUF4058)
LRPLVGWIEGRIRGSCYRRKQKEILASQVNLVEIDLLRGGEHTTAVPLEPAIDACASFDYHVSVHCFYEFGTFLVYPIHLHAFLPALAIPLLPDDGPVTINLQSIFDRCYAVGPYAREILYLHSKSGDRDDGLRHLDPNSEGLTM